MKTVLSSVAKVLRLFAPPTFPELEEARRSLDQFDGWYEVVSTAIRDANRSLSAFELMDDGYLLCEIRAAYTIQAAFLNRTNLEVPLDTLLEMYREVSDSRAPYTDFANACMELERKLISS